ncbi:Chitotriosidase-1 [Apiospora marii]|uniref:Chitotriosidase-1 n=1 Tax=Apiospora marii TaxID=335849 RepID=A0ABR1RBH4_9PEZI
MKFAITTLLLAAVASVSGASISREERSSSLEARANTSQQDFDQEDEVLKERGLCRSYKGEVPAYSDWKDLCAPKCGDQKALMAKANASGKTQSVSCLMNTKAPPYYNDPQGKSYTLGQCMCNLPIVNWAGDTFVAALPAIGQVTCAVWTEAAKSAAQILSGVNGAAGAKTGVQTLIKVAKMLKKQGKGVSEWEEYVKKHVAAGDACKFDVKKMFNDAVDIVDSSIPNV